MRTLILLAALTLVAAATPTAVLGASAGGGTEFRPGASAYNVRTAASPPACSDNAYNFLGPSVSWNRTLGWRFRMESVPSSLNGGDVLAVIRKSFRNIVNSTNTCGLADQVSATHDYLGTTTRRPAIDSAGNCGSSDGRNVVGFGPLDSYYAGFTCIWWDGNGHIIEMDMKLDTNTAWALDFQSCSNVLMMEALVTHEVGHAYGLDHVSETQHGRLTMSRYIDGNCENQESKLGLGDVRGLRALY